MRLPLNSSPTLALALLLIAGLLSGGSAFARCQGPVGIKVGNCAPNFTLKDLDGKAYTLSSLQGKVVFLNFWATWCKPCAVEIPSMGELHRKLEGQPVVMLSVSIDRDGRPAIDTYFKNVFENKRPPFPILLDSDSKVAESYGTFKVPETFIIDPQGRVRNKVEGVLEWNNSIVQSYLLLLAGQLPFK